MRGPRRALVLLVIGAALVLGAGPAAAAAELVRSDPASGAQVEQLTRVDLTFSDAVSISADGARVVAPDGTESPVTRVERVADDTVRVIVGDVGPGLRALTFVGTDEATGDPVSGSVAVAVGGPVSVLDTARATSATSGAALARALAVVALAVGIAVLAWMLLRARRRPDGAVIPLGPILAAAAAVALIGGVGGVWMAVRGASASSAAGPLALLGESAFGLWSAAIVVIAVLMLVARGRVWRGGAGLVLGAAIAVGAVAGLGGVATAQLPQPTAADVDLRTSLESGVQASLTLSPAAVGGNVATVVLGGLPADADAPALLLRPLDGRLGAARYPLTASAGGTFAAPDVLLAFAGRWRAEIRGVPGVTPEDPAVFDFDVQPNPGAVDGSGS
jgi:methionine-rich copper-binding protein CopC